MAGTLAPQVAGQTVAAVGRNVRRWFKRALPKTTTQREARSLLEEKGWNFTIGGKHVIKMEKDGHRPVTLPHCNGNAYSVGLTARILKEAGLK
jgi:predicted RNA binding protein YcfA (HicA-like mRNA interferase family)